YDYDDIVRGESELIASLDLELIPNIRNIPGTDIDAYKVVGDIAREVGHHAKEAISELGNKAGYLVHPLMAGAAAAGYVWHKSTIYAGDPTEEELRLNEVKGGTNESEETDNEYEIGNSGETGGANTKTGKQPGPTIDPNTGCEVETIYVDPDGNAMIKPKDGGFNSGGYRGLDTETTYPNGSSYQRNNPNGHVNSPGINHGHGHLPGTGPGRGGTGPSIDVHGNEVPYNSPDAHWPTYPYGFIERIIM
ncbi:MAG: hypothetical protein N4A68_03805, partial [Maledivibacter sp.]|nr:hypothetical protein [Maledivibacter sp.]